ncbi:hypothetical protein CVT25_011622 [Psilocybe cyanescens]|uniref:Amino acid transporter transmembrane domain-containing protein n=1 Tax=Psilocybe cyanescens TaxID=93625 RepID=A0A409WIS9_PSICY|nr:hypothetical protein CVT25_011622 [Psilocybe cyanescens]
MVQTYGIAPDNQVEQDTHGVSDESRALLGGDSGRVHSNKDDDGHASLVSCISNLSNTIIGSGMLTFPLAMASAGMIPGMITCVLSGSVAAFGLYLLSLCATKTRHRHASFHAISQLTFPGAAVFFDAAIATKCFGVSISYLIIIKGLMPNVVASLYHDLTSETTNPPEWALNGSNWLTLFMLILVPLCFLRQLNSLRHTSYVALFSVGYLAIIVIRCYFWPLKGMPEPGEIKLIHFTPNFVSTFPVQVFAFTCAQNLFPIYNELKNNSQRRMNTVIGGSIGAATLTYEVIAVGANIIAMYPSTSLFIAIGQLAIVILVLFSYPLQVHPCRNCLDKVFHPAHAIAPPKTATAGDDDDDEEPELGGDEHGHGPAEMSTIKHFVLTFVIIASGFTVAYLVDDLQMGGVVVCGSHWFDDHLFHPARAFLLEGILFIFQRDAGTDRQIMQLTRNDGSVSKGMNLGALCLMVYGICVFVFW